MQKKNNIRDTASCWRLLSCATHVTTPRMQGSQWKWGDSVISRERAAVLQTATEASGKVKKGRKGRRLQDGARHRHKSPENAPPTAAKHTPTGVHDPAVDAAFCKCREEVEAALLRCAPQQDWMRGPEMEDLICDVRARCVWFCCPMGCGVMSYCAAVVGCGRSSCSAQTPP